MPTLEWNVEKCLKQCSPVLSSDKASVFSKVRIKRSKIITFTELQEAYNHLANIIAVYGDRYLPLFERLHNELTEYRSKHELLDIAKSIGHKNLSTKVSSRKNIENISHIFSHVSHTNYLP